MAILDEMLQPTAPKHFSQANVQSLDNEMDKLHAQINFQQDIANCCMIQDGGLV